MDVAVKAMHKGKGKGKGNKAFEEDPFEGKSLPTFHS